jgi:hypothetical protein
MTLSECQAGCALSTVTNRRPFLQGLDALSSHLAKASFAVQVAGVVWRLLGQLVAVEGIVFVLFKPRWMVGLHMWLAALVLRLSRGLHRAGVTEHVIDISESTGLPANQ